MANGHFALLRELVRPKIVKISGGVFAFLAIYDAASNQFSLPKLGKVVGMSGNLLPWWGWLLVLQTLFVYALFEYVRRVIAPDPDRPAAVDLARLKVRIAAVEERQKAIIEDYQRMLGELARCDTEVAQIRSETKKLWANIEEWRRAYYAQQSLDDDRAAAQFMGLHLALAAVWHRERLQSLGNDIETGAVELAAATQKQATYNQDEWELWEAKEGTWRATLALWCALAANYVPGIEGKVLEITERHYKLKGVAKVEQFPDPEAFIAYKAFCALYKNWLNLREEAARAVHQSAFNGGGRPIFDGAGDLEELGERPATH